MNKSIIKAIQRGRERKIEQAGTAPFTFLNTGDIAADTNKGGWIIDFTAESKTRRYAPFDFLSINNSSTEDLNVFINQRDGWQKLVRAGTIVQISEFPGVRGLRISKRGTGTIVAGEVEVMVMRLPLSQDELVRRDAAANPILRIARILLGV